MNAPSASTPVNVDPEQGSPHSNPARKDDVDRAHAEQGEGVPLVILGQGDYERKVFPLGQRIDHD